MTLGSHRDTGKVLVLMDSLVGEACLLDSVPTWLHTSSVLNGFVFLKE